MEKIQIEKKHCLVKIEKEEERDYQATISFEKDSSLEFSAKGDLALFLNFIEGVHENAKQNN